jgi:hypothetical protein
VLADFKGDLMLDATTQLLALGCAIPDGPAEGTSPIYALAAYLEYRLPARPRDVAMSCRLRDRALGGLESEGVRRISRALETGEQLLGFQAVPSAGGCGVDERLLDDWGIHHFELAPAGARPSPYRCAGPQLFAWLDETRAVLVDVQEPEGVDVRDLLETLDQTCPDAVARAPGPEDLSADGLDEDGTPRILRLASAIRLRDGSLLLPRQGGARQRDRRSRANTRAHEWIREAQFAEDRCRHAAHLLGTLIEARTGRFVEALVLRLQRGSAGYEIVETTSGFRLPLNFGVNLA